MVIDKRAFFAVRFASNMKNKSLEERGQMMCQIHPDARPLVTKALMMSMESKTGSK